MPRKARGPYLYWNKREETWWIRDGQKVRRTGRGESEVEGARHKLAEYIAGSGGPDTSQHHPDKVRLSDCLELYAQVKIHEKPDTHRRNELVAQCTRLVDFAGTDTLSQINGSWCRSFALRSSTTSMARHDLEVARAAVNFYNREFGLVHVPAFTLPAKGKARTHYLQRAHAARLLRAVRQMGYSHLARYVLIGIYTGTRSGAILRMQWMPSVTGGWFDLDREVIYRAADDERQTRKRKPPAAIPGRLVAHLKRWKRMDTANGAIIPHVVHYKGKPVKSIKRSWKQARDSAGLPEWVIPHVLRHTAITWAMQRGVNINTVASYFGITIQELQRTYWQHHPDFQEEMRRTK